ncbi:phospholipase D-like domain-containing protein [Coraliomargarita sinensis]|nr:phospholipase D-like domain-containing protein [Coraliomargarita sinensis]
MAELLGAGILFLLTNFFIVLGIICAVLILRRVSEERRSPSNTFAWLLLVLLIPFLGVPLYLLFGGRKSRRKARLKSEISRYAESLSLRETPAENKLDPLVAEADAQCSQGNHFELLPDGASTYQRLLHEIDEAEHTIHIATYILGNDRSGQTIIDRLAKRATEGVTVRVLLDSLGSWNKTRLARVKIRQCGGEVAMFIPVLPLQSQTSANLRNHRKIAIFDNYRAITGGQNLDNRFLGDWPDEARFTDFSVVTQGPAVAELSRTFIADWTFAAKQSPARYKEILQYIPEEAGNSTVEVIASGPDIPDDPLWEQVLRIIQEFKQHLTIVTPYFIPDEVLLQSLLVKAHTGRRIQLILPLRSNQRMADIARFRTLAQLHTAGVEILFYEPGMLHAKLVLADDMIALTGSANIDARSLFVNFEIALAHYTAADIRTLSDWAINLKKDCIDYKTAMSDASRIPSKLSQDVVQLLVPLL